ncbi:MAG TPA: sn-glycerol-3-phosphate ABC transporter ATP-binding protein UgpC [Acetobacteraceae bacterium]|jgi:sn-glycerol 3-phosphate transport system ATP-binding protein|nr:sn-glycerol-3-phosphate ABC transporter ATP-binding protein UgpC [Acetobacteraceae bacterium]
MATLTIEGLRKSFGDVHVLHGVDLALADGEMLVIVGASGCGKSTLLRLVAGLETPTAGRIVLDGRDVSRLDPAERDIAMVFQNYALYPHMSVFDNMAYGLRIRGLKSAEIRRRVDEAAGLLGLGELLARKPRQLSGGQRQRVAMGRAIVREPKLFLFDEPLSNLDARLRVQMRAEIRRIQRRLGVTSLYVTHDQVEAMTLGDRLLVLHQGRPVQLATPMEVFERPADTYVASFIGTPSMNFLPASLAGLSDAKLTVGIRPEHVVVDGAGLPMQVNLVEPLGSETLLHGRVGQGTEITVKVTGAAPSAPHLRFPREALHLFDAATGRRMEGTGATLR